MYKGSYYDELNRIASKMKDLTYTPFEYLVITLLILLVEIKLDSCD